MPMLPPVRRILLAALLPAAGVLAWLPPARAQTPPPDAATAVESSRVHERLAGQALAARDWPRYLAEVRGAERLRPHHPALVYHLARALALTDSGEAALRVLQRMARMGVTSRAAGDSAFAALRGRADFEAVIARFARNAEPFARSRLAFTVPERSFLPEGVARDPRTGDFFVASVHQRRIVRVHEGLARPFAAGVRMWSPMGMAADPARGRLWVATAAAAEGRDTDSASVGRSELLALDLASGAEVARYGAPADSLQHWFGDLALAPNGDVYVSDSRAPGVFVLRAGATALTPVPMLRTLSPQGLAVSADGAALYLADYALGIVRLDLHTGASAPVPYPDDATLLGVDGLVRDGHDLIAIQNGVAPLRVLRLVLTADGRRIRAVEPLEAAHPLYAEPSLGVVSRDTLFYNVAGQWDLFADGREPPPDSTMPPRVLALPLHP